MISCFAEPGSY